jgi:hypothetical protein
VEALERRAEVTAMPVRARPEEAPVLAAPGTKAPTRTATRQRAVAAKVRRLAAWTTRAQSPVEVVMLAEARAMAEARAQRTEEVGDRGEQALAVRGPGGRAVEPMGTAF